MSVDSCREHYTFGAAELVLDRDGESCIVTVETPTICAPVMRTVHLNSLEEIERAYRAQIMQMRAKTKTRAAEDFLAALKFAGTTIARNRAGKSE